MNRKDELINNRELLQNERNELNNKRVSKIKLSLYVWGIALTAAISSVLFLESAPVLIYLFSFLFTFGVPCVYFMKNILKDNKLKDEIALLDKDILAIEREEARKKAYSREPKPVIFNKESKDNRSALEVVSDGLKRFDRINIQPVNEDGPKLSLRK